MAKKLTFCSLSIVALLLLSSCDKPGVRLAVLRGNYSYGRGEFQEASNLYLQALDDGFGEYRIRYNLGNVYYELGEEEAASSQWSSSLASVKDSDLLFRINFNRGVLFYEQADYQKAFQAFRQALRIDSSSLDAKINLEYVLNKLNRGDREQSSGSGSGKSSGSGEAQRVLNYVRRSESSSWSTEAGSSLEREGKQW